MFGSLAVSVLFLTTCMLYSGNAILIKCFTIFINTQIVHAEGSAIIDQHPFCEGDAREIIIVESSMPWQYINGIVLGSLTLLV